MAKNSKRREQLPKSTKPVELSREVLTGAQQRASEFREAAKERELSVPEGTPEDAKTIHDFDVWAEGYDTLHLTAEDESECLRQFRLCYGITNSSIKVMAKYKGTDPRPKPRQAPPESAAAGTPAT